MNMSIHRALGEIKLYDKKIYDLLQSDFVMAAKSKATKIKGKNVDDYRKELQSNLQSVKALMRNRQILKTAIAESNARTKVTIGGEEMTVLDAIERKNYMNIRMSVVNTLQNQFNRADREVQNYEANFQAGLERYLASATKDLQNKDLVITLTESYKTVNEIVLIDPNNLRDVVAAMTAENDRFNTEVDYVLSESNSTTFVDVNLEG